jgi:hypothetical protein
MVSLGSTSSVIVLPVRVFTKICGGAEEEQRRRRERRVSGGAATAN